jgi:hypothetical protein
MRTKLIMLLAAAALFRRGLGLGREARGLLALRGLAERDYEIL